MDNKEEYVLEEFYNYCKIKRIKRSLTNLYTSKKLVYENEK